MLENETGTGENEMKLRIDRHKALSGGIIGLVGYILSPLSWWNDMFINFPLAYAGAWMVSLFYKSAFGASFVIFYWITNILGFLMIHKGVSRVVGKDSSSRPYFRNGFLWDLLAALAYTILMVILVKYDIIKPMGGYFPS